MKRAGSVDEYISDTSNWQGELKRLREILRSTELEEDVKWGALLKDDIHVLMNAQEGRTKALRQWRMQTGKDIKPAIIKSYVREAIKLVQEGKQIAPARKKAGRNSSRAEKGVTHKQGGRSAFQVLAPGPAMGVLRLHC